jgi:HlyD family secretion protein
MKLKILIAAVLVACAAAGVMAWTKKEAVPATTAKVEVSQPPLVAAAGLVEPLSEEIKIGTELNGKIREITVEEGDRVRRGQILVVLENGDYKARLALAEAQLAQKQAQELRVQNGSRSEEKRESEATVIEAKAVYDEARAEWDRRESLFRSGDIPRASLDKAQREMAVAKARYEAAGERRGIVHQASREEDFLTAKADVTQAKAHIAEAQALLEKTLIRSPIDGVILRKKGKAGESVSADNPDGWILSLGDDSTLRVRVDVDEADVANVQAGQSAYVTAEAYGSKKFTGRVVRVGQILGRKNIRTDEPTERVDKKILETLVELDAGQKLPSGLRVDTFIRVQ